MIKNFLKAFVLFRNCIFAGGCKQRRKRAKSPDSNSHDGSASKALIREDAGKVYSKKLFDELLSLVILSCL
jgi:hypothetical protein